MPAIFCRCHFKVDNKHAKLNSANCPGVDNLQTITNTIALKRREGRLINGSSRLARCIDFQHRKISCLNLKIPKNAKPKRNNNKAIDEAQGSRICGILSDIGRVTNISRTTTPEAATTLTNGGDVICRVK